MSGQCPTGIAFVVRSRLPLPLHRSVPKQQAFTSACHGSGVQISSTQINSRSASLTAPMAAAYKRLQSSFPPAAAASQKRSKAAGFYIGLPWQRHTEGYKGQRGTIGNKEEQKGTNGNKRGEEEEEEE